MKLWSTALASGDRLQFKGGQRTEAVPGSPNKHDRCKADKPKGVLTAVGQQPWEGLSAPALHNKMDEAGYCKANFEQSDPWLGEKMASYVWLCPRIAKNGRKRMTQEAYLAV